jgi:hypothetical protein
VNNFEIHHICVGIECKEMHWKLLNNTGLGEKYKESNRGDWLTRVQYVYK